jgi:SAM-dependent methyltransferase
METQTEDPTYAAYELLAPFYDSYTREYGHERWLDNLEAIAIGHGLRGNRLLDVGCGTGKSFLPMLARGYEVTGCDISPAMVERAREAAGGEASLLVADARDLPVLGRFDLVTSLDDALNYVVSDAELGMAFAGVAQNLRPGGLFVFDLTSIAAYRKFFAIDMATDEGDAFFCWRGEADPTDTPPGSIVGSVIEVFATDDGECWRRYSSRHVQRHHPPELVARLLARSGFELLSRRGQMTGAQIDPVGDDERHSKLVYFARRLPSAFTKGTTRNGGESR